MSRYRIDKLDLATIEICQPKNLAQFKFCQPSKQLKNYSRSTIRCLHSVRIYPKQPIPDTPIPIHNPSGVRPINLSTITQRTGCIISSSWSRPTRLIGWAIVTLPQSRRHSLPHRLPDAGLTSLFNANRKGVEARISAFRTSQNCPTVS